MKNKSLIKTINAVFQHTFITAAAQPYNPLIVMHKSYEEYIFAHRQD